MSVKNRSLVQRILFSLAAAVALAVSVTSLGGLFVFSSGPSDAKDMFYIYYPLLAFPLSLIPFVSPRAGSVIFCFYSFGNWLYEFVISLPEIALNPFDSLVGSALICAAVLFCVGLLFSGSNKEGVA